MAGRPPSEVVRCHSTRRELATCVWSACAVALSLSPRTASPTADSISARAVRLRTHHTPLQHARDTSSDARIADLPSFITPNTAPSTPSPPSPARTACPSRGMRLSRWQGAPGPALACRSEEHTSELQSHSDLVCRLLLEKKKNTNSER